MVYLFENKDISIRKMEDTIEDYELMARWLSTVEVLDYYEGRSNSFNLEKVIKKYKARVITNEAITPCIIEYKQNNVGYIQYYQIDIGEYAVGDKISRENYRFPHGIDLFIGEINNWNKGIGTIIVSSMISYLFKSQSTDIIFIDPQTWNKRAIRCYEKSGFIPRWVIKNREIHDGEYKDSLIMSITLEDWKSTNYNK